MLTALQERLVTIDDRARRFTVIGQFHSVDPMWRLGEISSVG
jgi:hypothetical protein